MLFKTQLEKSISDRIEGAPVEQLSSLILDIYKDTPTEKRKNYATIFTIILHELCITGYDYNTSSLLADITVAAIKDYIKLN